MNSDGINRINFLRTLYQSKQTGSSSEEVRELQQIKGELQIANEEKIRDTNQITNSTNSPYLPDQLFYKKDTVYNSSLETDWKTVRTAEQTQQDSRLAYLESNRRKLNII